MPGSTIVYPDGYQTTFARFEQSTTDPAAFVISANIRRRHLTKEQQAELIVKTIEAAKPKEPIDRATSARSFNPTNGKRGGSTKDPVLTKAVEEAKKHGISKRTVQNARAKVQGKTLRPKQTPSTTGSRVLNAAVVPHAEGQCRKCGAPFFAKWPDGDPVCAECRYGSMIDSGTKKPRLDVHFSSESSEHYTPKPILDAVLQALGAIDLDPCSNTGTPIVPARRHFTASDNGLAKPWKGRVYLNPPYGREIDKWIKKLVDEYTAQRVTAAIALLPARTDTEWFHRLREYPVCFIRGRLTFGGNTEPAPFPSIVVNLGNDIERFHQVFSALGDIWARVPPIGFGPDKLHASR